MRFRLTESVAGQPPEVGADPLLDKAESPQRVFRISVDLSVGIVIPGHITREV